mmetsp:Transcript_9472/g.20426  ORF Transcript_9472/g.20426 Transcript_9472/m.20426 type:complete len:328 (+) Transcript_9472:132-1115(+)
MSQPTNSPNRTGQHAQSSSTSTGFAAAGISAGSAPSMLSGSAPSLLGGAKPSLLAAAGRSSSAGAAAGRGVRQPHRAAENLPPRTLARVARDVRDLVRSPPEGVRLVLDEETGMPGSLSEILAEIEGPEQTPYHTKIFQLKLVISADFPATPPRGHFITKIYHPNVDMSTGAICVNTLKKDWTPATSLGHVLTVIRCLMIVPFPESSLNDEAGKNFMESYDEYARRARLLANVHGLDGWTSSGDGDDAMETDGGVDAVAGGTRNLKSEEPAGDKDVGDAKKMQNNNPNSNAANPPAKLGRMGSRSNIPARGKGVDKKNAKKKSLRRL